MQTVAFIFTSSVLEAFMKALAVSGIGFEALLPRHTLRAIRILSVEDRVIPGILYASFALSVDKHPTCLCLVTIAAS